MISVKLKVCTFVLIRAEIVLIKTGVNLLKRSMIRER